MRRRVLIEYSTESGVEQEIKKGVKQLNKGQGETLYTLGD